MAVVCFLVPGHVLAIFHLGEMNAKGGSGQRNCQNAVEVGFGVL